MRVSRFFMLTVTLLTLTLLAASLPAQAQRAVGRCPTVVTVPVRQYYVPTPQAMCVPPGHRATVVIVMPRAQPAPSPFGPRYDKHGRLIAISTPQFIGSPSLCA